MALDALALPVQRYRAAVAATVEDVSRRVEAQREGAGGRVAQLAAELGPLAAGRVDVEGLASFLGRWEAVERGALEVMEAALGTLRALLARGEELFVVRVEGGGRLEEVVAVALAEAGRAFGAARVVELAKSGSYRAAEHEGWLAAFPFHAWSRAERRLAPPLVVEVDGRDLRAAGLAEFLDGAVKLVLVVRGEAVPAALVRLITPGVFVLQTVDGSGLDRLAAAEGPGVAALVPEGAARFLHDPAAGREPWERLRVDFLPDSAPRRALGGMSAAQQAEELAQLRALMGAPVAGVTAAGVGPGVVGGAVSPAPADPVDKLAAWLLRQADLSGIG